MKKHTLDEILIKCKEVHGEKYLYNDLNYVNAKTKCKIYCTVCHEYFFQTMDAHLNSKNGCKNCAVIKASNNLRYSLQEFITKAKHIHGEKYEYSSFKYINYNTTGNIYCKTCKKYFKQSPSKHLAGQNCPTCAMKEAGINKKYSQEEIISIFNTVHSSYSYEMFEYLGYNIKGKIKCLKCENYFFQTPANHINGEGCPICSLQKRGLSKRLTKQQFVDMANSIHLERYDYSDFVYIKSNIKGKIYCNYCKEYFWQTPNHHLTGNGCPHCKRSKGEYKVKELLKLYNMDFIEQGTLAGCISKRLLRFDFILYENDKIIGAIEYNGKQHYEPVQWSYHMNEDDIALSFKENKNRDIIKIKYCSENNIPLLSIKYSDQNNMNIIIEKFISEIL
jgi:formylmethanofuran dehydrogenase subunit E